MRSKVALTHEFVEFIPEDLQEATLYVCVPFATVVHRCCCGCGREVVTPLSPTDWKLIFDGVSVSLYPSVGNWSFPCQSHYWIQHNRAHWAERWSRDQIDAGRAADALAKAGYFGRHVPSPESSVSAPDAATESADAANIGSPGGTAEATGGWRGFLRRLFGE